MISLSVIIVVVIMGIFIFSFGKIAIDNEKEIVELNKKNIELIDKYEKEISDLNNIIFKLRSDLELSRRRCDRKDYSKMRKD